MISSLPSVGGPSRKKDIRRRRQFRFSSITMLYIAMLVLLTVSPGFLIGRRPGSTPAAAAGQISTETKAIRQRGHHLLDDQRVAASFRRPPEIKTKPPTQKFSSGRGFSLRQTRAWDVHTYGRREASASYKYNTRRSLQAGPGSSLPSCSGKCGVCSPCKPVHVAIGSSHEVISETEYYPEVWRCQCGNQLFIP
ncbi:unnamed protein product [Sphagnum troendelagicum]|uniref:Epidermal patterning factor-like protein n=1 Tax=Sphagnum troendelagicum TaxID=128251 RepID=A0ABP0T944_9BRYO